MLSLTSRPDCLRNTRKLPATFRPDPEAANPSDSSAPAHQATTPDLSAARTEHFLLSRRRLACRMRLRDTFIKPASQVASPPAPCRRDSSGNAIHARGSALARQSRQRFTCDGPRHRHGCAAQRIAAATAVRGAFEGTASLDLAGRRSESAIAERRCRSRDVPNCQEARKGKDARQPCSRTLPKHLGCATVKRRADEPSTCKGRSARLASAFAD